MMRFKLKKALVAFVMTSFVLGACSSPDISDDDTQDEKLEEDSSEDNEHSEDQKESEDEKEEEEKDSEEKESEDDSEDSSEDESNTAFEVPAVYDEFLNNEAKTTFSDDFEDDSHTAVGMYSTDGTNASKALGAEDGFTLDELCQYLSDDFEVEDGDDISKSYAFVDFGSDGNYELVFRYQHGSIHTVYFVFSAESGSVELMYSADDGERWSTNLLDNGYVDSYGAGGAGDHSGTVGGLDEKGAKQTFKTEQIVYYGFQIAFVPKDDDFNEVINTWAEADEKRQGEAICYAVVHIGDNYYYCYDLAEDNGDISDEDIQELVDLAAEYDIDIIDYDEIDDIVSDYQKELGMEDITYESGNEITFIEM